MRDPMSNLDPRNRPAQKLAKQFEVWLRERPDDVDLWVARGWEALQAFMWRRAGFEPSDARSWNLAIDDDLLRRLDPGMDLTV